MTPDVHWPRNRVIDTTWLTHAKFEPTAPRQDRRQRLLAAGALLLLVIATGHGFAGEVFVKARDLAALREERNLLSAEVERLRTELAVESATRRELERNAADLSAQVAELNGQVEFLRARKASIQAAQ